MGGYAQAADLRHDITSESEIFISCQFGLFTGHCVISVSLEDEMGRTCVEAEAVYFAFNKERADEMGFSGCDLYEE